MSRFTAAHSASWGRNGPRNLLGPLGTRSLGGDELINLVEISKFAVDVGNGSSTAIVITHGLATRDVRVQVYRNSTPWDTVECEVEHTDANTVTLRFDVAPTSAQYRAVVLGRVPSVPFSIVSRHPRALPPARRGHISPFVPPAVVAAAPSIIPGQIGKKHPAVLPPARRGTSFRVPLVGRAPGQLDVYPSIVSRHPKLGPLPRRGRITYFPLVGRAPGQLDVYPAITSRHPKLAPIPRRGHFFSPVPPPVIVVATGLPSFISSRRPKISAPRRGTFSWRGLVVPALPAEFGARRPRIVPTARRGHIAFFPLVGRAPGQLDVYPLIVSRHPRVLPPARRGQFQARLDAIAPVTQGQLPPSLPTRHPRALPPARRGHFAFFPIVGQAPAPPYPLPITSRHPRVAPPAHRGTFFKATLPVTQQPIAPSFDVRSVRLSLPTRRGRFSVVPTAQASPVPALGGKAHPRSFTAPRRGRFFTTFTPTQKQLAPMPIVSRHPRALPPARRGHITTIVAPTPPKLAPAWVHRYNRTPAVLRRSQRIFNIPPLGGLAPPPVDVIHQPSLLHYLNEPIRLQVTSDQVVLDNGVPKTPPIIWPPNTGIYLLTTVEKISLDGEQPEPQIIGWVVDDRIRLDVTVDRAVLSTSVEKVAMEASEVLELVPAGHGVMSFDGEDWRPVNLNSLIR